ncbi:MAG TPA: hypothetical protein VKX16_12840 [Chloroflexota bacterium]|nr:hypothetical protein [Chloroflexota bacterium]
MPDIGADPRVKAALAKLQHFWWRDRFPATAYPENLWWRNRNDALIVQVLADCEAACGADQEYVAPFSWLFGAYRRWAIEQGASEDDASDFAASVIYGKPSDSGELVSGYYQNPHWYPLSNARLRGRLWEKTAAERHEVTSREAEIQDADSLGVLLDRSLAVTEVLEFAVGEDADMSWYTRSPEQVVMSEETRTLRLRARAERQRVAGPYWHAWNESALASANPSNRAGGRSDREWIEAFGPWDVFPVDYTSPAGFLPSTSLPLPLKPAASNAEGRALTRARLRYLDALAAAAGYESAKGRLSGFLREIVIDPRNHAELEGDDLIDIVRIGLGFSREAWLLSIGEPAPLFFQQVIGAASILSLYLAAIPQPPAVRDIATAMARSDQ